MPTKKTAAKQTKGSNLLDEIKKIPDSKLRFRGVQWSAWKKKHKPKEFAQIIEVIQDFLNYGKTATVFRTKTELWTWLSGKDKDRPREPIFEASRCAFERFVERVQNGEEKA